MSNNTNLEKTIKMSISDRMRYKIEAKEWGTQAQKKIGRSSSEWDRDEEETRKRY